jgi:microcystin-dependent protein
MIVGRAYFFTPTVNTERFLSKDEPTEQVMRNFLDSIAFKKEASDTASETQQGLVETATQAEFIAGTDNNANGYALYVRPSMIKSTLDSIVSNFNSQISTITNDITNLQNSVTNLENNVTNLTNTVTLGFQEQMPIGSMIEYPVATPPNSKWLLCEGQTLNTGSYPDLFALIGYNFGGAGVNFNLPDKRGKFTAGFDSAGSAEYQTIGQGGGSNDVTLTNAQIPKHNHVLDTGVDGASQSDPGDHNHRGGYTFNSILEGGDVPPDQTWDIDEGGAAGPNFKRVGAVPFSDGAHTHTGNTGDGTTDGLNNQPHENRPEFVVFPTMIKVLN